MGGKSGDLPGSLSFHPPPWPASWLSSPAEVAGAVPVGEEYTCARLGLDSEHKDPTRTDGKMQNEEQRPDKQRDKQGHHQRDDHRSWSEAK